MMASFGSSKEFQELLRQISEAHNKQEEERHIVAEKARLKQRVAQPNISTKQMKELVVRLLYCEMLGHEVAFGYIHAINLIQKTKDMLEKRTAYLAVSLFLHENHELTILLVQTIINDLKGQNYIDMSSALTVLSRLASKEIIPIVLPHVQTCLSHPKELVRKKAALCLQRFYQRAPASVTPLAETIRRLVCDKDASVMGASLSVVHAIAQDSPELFRDFAPTFVTILKTVIDNRVGRGYDYHGVPAPWYQIKLLKILAILGQDNQACSEGMYTVLLDALKKAETGVDAAYAVLYEIITTITTIYPHVGLIATAAKCISRFLTSSNANLKYLGITALAAIVKVDPAHAVPHQLVVIDCLENPDETIKRKTLDLLYKMTNKVNVVVIADKMLEYLRTTVDDYMRVELVSRITTLAETFAPNNQWFVKTMAVVFELGGSLVRPKVADNLMRLIAAGTEDDERDNELRVQAVNEYMALLQRKHLPDILMHVVAWALGEYAYLSEAFSLEQVLDQLVVTFERGHLAPEQRGWLISSMMKIVAQLGECPLNVRSVVQKCKVSKDIDIAQRAREFDSLVTSGMAIMTSVLPTDASCEDIEVDDTLSFLDAYVNDYLRTPGARRYVPPAQRTVRLAAAAADEPASKPIRFEAYDAPKPFVPSVPVVEPIAAADAAASPSIFDVPESTTASTAAASTTELVVPETKRKWGKQGYIGKAEPQVVPVPAPMPAAPASAPTAAAAAAAALAPTTPTASPAQAAAAPRQLTEKEKMANALFGSLSSSVPATATAPTAAPARTTKTKATRQDSKPSSIAADLLALEASEPAATPPPALAAMDLLSISSVPEQAAPTAPAAAEDEFMTMRITKLKHASQGLVLSVHLSSSGARNLTDVQIRYDVPAGFRTSPSNTSFVAATPLAFNQPITHQLTLVPAPHRPLPAPVTGVVSYADPTRAPRTLPFQLTIGIADVLRPLVLVTPEFGARWPTLAQEVKAVYRPVTVANQAQLMQRLKAGLDAHPVEIIGTEGISAAAVNGTNEEVLLHCKLDDSHGCTVSVRSANKTLSENVLKETKALIS